MEFTHWTTMIDLYIYMDLYFYDFELLWHQNECFYNVTLSVCLSVYLSVSLKFYYFIGHLSWLFSSSPLSESIFLSIYSSLCLCQSVCLNSNYFIGRLSRFLYLSLPLSLPPLFLSLNFGYFIW